MSMDTSKWFGEMRRYPVAGLRLGAGAPTLAGRPKAGADESGTTRRYRRTPTGGTLEALRGDRYGGMGPRRIPPGVVSRMREVGDGGATDVRPSTESSMVSAQSRPTGGGGMQQPMGALRRRQVTLPTPRLGSHRRPNELKWIMKPVKGFLQYSESSSEDSGQRHQSEDETTESELELARDCGRSAGGSRSRECLENHLKQMHLDLSDCSLARNERGQMSSARVPRVSSQRILLDEDLKQAQLRQMQSHRTGSPSPTQRSPPAPAPTSTFTSFSTSTTTTITTSTPTPTPTGTTSFTSAPNIKTEASQAAPSAEQSTSASTTTSTSTPETSKESSLSTSGSERNSQSRTSTSELVARAVERFKGGVGTKAIKLTSTVIQIMQDTPACEFMEKRGERRTINWDTEELRENVSSDETPATEQLKTKLQTVFQANKNENLKTKKTPSLKLIGAPMASKTVNQMVDQLTQQFREATTPRPAKDSQKTLKKLPAPSQKSSFYMLMNAQGVQSMPKPKEFTWIPHPIDQASMRPKLPPNNMPKPPVKAMLFKNNNPLRPSPANQMAAMPAKALPPAKALVSMNRNAKQVTPPERRQSPDMRAAGPGTVARVGTGAKAGPGDVGKITCKAQHMIPKTIEDGIDMSYQYFVSIPLQRGRKAQVVRYLYRPMVRYLNAPATPTRRALRKAAKRKAAAEAAAAQTADEEADAEATDLEEGQPKATEPDPQADPELLALGGAPLPLEVPKLVPDPKLFDPKAALHAPYEEPPLKLNARYMPLLRKLADMPYPQERDRRGRGRGRHAKRQRVAGGSEHGPTPPELSSVSGKFRSGLTSPSGTGGAGGGDAISQSGRSMTDSRSRCSRVWPQTPNSLINYRPDATLLGTSNGIPISYHTPVLVANTRLAAQLKVKPEIYLQRDTGPMIRAVTYEDIEAEQLVELEKLQPCKTSVSDRASGGGLSKNVNFQIPDVPEPDNCAPIPPIPHISSSSGTSISISSLSSQGKAAKGTARTGRKKKAKPKPKPKPKSKSKTRGKSRR